MDDQPQYPPPPSWPHLLQPVHQPPSSYPSPTDTTYYHQHQPPPPPSSAGSIPRSESGLSLNMSTLSVASSNPPSTASALSPVTPVSPAHNMATPQPQQGAFAQHQPNTFRFAPPDIAHFEQAQYDAISVRRPPGSSRSSSSSEKSVPRKRSLTTSSMPLSVSVEEDINFDSTLDDSDIYYGIESSPIDGSPSSGEHPDEFRIIESHLGPPSANGVQPGSSFTILGKTSSSNNFVSKLYQMISDPKSANFISWTDPGTSFMVSNIGEFSRSILGSHFKHNNFSSFVRQLNMYGFHKINRTPRAQRTSTDAQTWEFSHPKFLRGRTDLLDDIKRKSLEQDIAAIKQRIELPAEVAIQLNRISEDHRRTVKALATERQKVERLAGVVKVMYDMMASAYPGQMPIPFPTELLDSPENPPILITSHSHSQSASQRRPSPSSTSTHPSRYNAALNSAGVPMHTNISPCSSPTASDFPHSYHHTPAPPHYDPDLQTQSSASQPQQQQHPHSHAAPPHTPSPDNTLSPHPNGTLGDEHGPSPKRQRTVTGQSAHHERKLSRARSDSAPLGYGFGVHPYGGAVPLGRPRSGSNLVGGVTGAVVGLGAALGVGTGNAASAGGGSGLAVRGGRREDGFLGPVPGSRMSLAGVPAPSFSIPGMTIKNEPSYHVT